MKKNKQSKKVVATKKGFIYYLKRHPMLYVMMIPGFFFLFIYKFLPLYGILMVSAF